MQSKLEEILLRGEEANNHARYNIKTGLTEIGTVNSTVRSDEYKRYAKETVIGLRNQVNTSTLERIFNENLMTNPLLINFEEYIKHSSRCYIGNCIEYALHALNYIIINLNSSIFAEIFHVENGDHVFLVLNRKLSSDPKDPKTWGHDAVICDPWANKVYQAKYYLTELKTLNYDSGQFVLKDFNPHIHFFAKYPFNSYDLSTTNLIAELKENFSQKVKDLSELLDYYLRRLSLEAVRIEAKYDHDPRGNLLTQKVKKLSLLIKTLDSEKHNNYGNFENLTKAKEFFTNQWSSLRQEAAQCMQFSEHEQAILMDFVYQETSVMRFFGKKSNAHNNLEQLTNYVNTVFPK